MRISKLMPLVCSTALCASVVGVVQAEDNPAQAAARAALLEKLGGVNVPASSDKSGVIPPDNAAAPVPPAAPVAPVVPAQPIVAVPALTPVPVTAVKQVIIPPDTDAQYRARTALLEKLTEPEPQPNFQKDNDAQAKARAALLDKLTEPEPQPAYQKDNDAQAAARAALVEKLPLPDSSLVTAPPTPAPVAAAPVAPAPVPAPVAVAAPVPAPAPVVTAPVPTLTPAQTVALTKEMRLKELLIKYEADQITPAEYHAKRAAIVNGE